jgi:hypothetical protein
MARSYPPIWLTQASRWAGLAKSRARFGLCLLAALFASTLLVLASPAPPPVTADPAHAGDNRADVDLYRTIVADVRHGAPYYQAAAAELRTGDYPLKPFVTFRLPTLALIQSALPSLAVTVLLYALAAGVMLAWFLRLGDGLAGWRPRVIALFLLAAGLAAFVQAELAPFHEVWAGLLVALSLAMWRPGRWVDAAAVALVAMLVRETAALYALVMVGAAMVDGRRREALGWAAALAVFAVAVALHAHAVSLVVRPDDLHSPGWAGLLGPGFFVRAISVSTALHLAPDWIAALLLGLSLFGWASWRDPLAARALATLLAYAMLLSLFGRVDTFYWGLLAAPLSLLGLGFAPDGLRDLIAAALDRRRVIVTKRVT